MPDDRFITVSEASLHHKEGRDLLSVAFRIPHGVALPYSPGAARDGQYKDDWVRALKGGRKLEHRILTFLNGGKRPIICEATEISQQDTAQHYRITMCIDKNPQLLLNLANALDKEKLLNQSELSLPEAERNAGLGVTIDAPSYMDFLIALNAAVHRSSHTPKRVA